MGADSWNGPQGLFQNGTTLQREELVPQAIPITKLPQGALATAATAAEGHILAALQELNKASLELAKLGNWTAQLDLAKAIKDLTSKTNIAVRQARELQA